MILAVLAQILDLITFAVVVDMYDISGEYSVVPSMVYANWGLLGVATFKWTAVLGAYLLFSGSSNPWFRNLIMVGVFAIGMLGFFVNSLSIRVGL